MHRNPSVMEHSFARVPKAEIPRSSFDRSHGYKTTFDAGYLIPFLVDEVVPGDTASVNMTGFARMATPIFPLMDNMRMTTFFFFVPYRLIYTLFPKMMGEQDNPDDTTDYVFPTMNSGAGYASGSLHDYFGLPVGVADIDHISLYHRAYNLIWNQWFRDQNLQDSVVVDKDEGPDDPADYVLLKRGKRFDYFTSCLVAPQKGDAVQIPLGTQADVVFPSYIYTDGTVRKYSDLSSFGNHMVETSNTPVTYLGGTQYATSPPAVPSTPDQARLRIDGGEFNSVYADLSTATAATINSLRQAFQIQKVLERDARGGTRYTEMVRAHFGVTSPDARLQRPEYLGGGSSPVSITPVPQTSSTDVTTPQGNLAAMGTALLHGHGFTSSFTEHGLIIGLVCVTADLTYQQGLQRMWSRSTRFDVYLPALAHIGEQAVLSKEIYCDGSANDEDVFGYQERFAEMRYKPSQVTGLFRSAAAGSLDSWHLSQEFSSRPTLGSDFIEENPPLDRVIAVPSQPHFLFDAYIGMHWARPMPVFGVPGLMDHF